MKEVTAEFKSRFYWACINTLKEWKDNPRPHSDEYAISHVSEIDKLIKEIREYTDEQLSSCVEYVNSLQPARYSREITHMSLNFFHIVKSKIEALIQKRKEKEKIPKMTTAKRLSLPCLIDCMKVFDTDIGQECLASAADGIWYVFSKKDDKFIPEKQYFEEKDERGRLELERRRIQNHQDYLWGVGRIKVGIDSDDKFTLTNIEDEKKHSVTSAYHSCLSFWMTCFDTAKKDVFQSFIIIGKSLEHIEKVERAVNWIGVNLASNKIDDIESFADDIRGFFFKTNYMELALTILDSCKEIHDSYRPLFLPVLLEGSVTKAIKNVLVGERKGARLKKDKIEGFKKRFLNTIEEVSLLNVSKDVHSGAIINLKVDRLFEFIINSELNNIPDLEKCKSYIWDEWGEEDAPEDLLLYQRIRRHSVLVKVKSRIEDMIKALKSKEREKHNEFGTRIVREAGWIKKDEETYKPGDRVFFVRHTITDDKDSDIHRTNCYIGVIEEFLVQVDGKKCIKLVTSFHSPNDSRGHSEELSKGDISQFIENEKLLFPRADGYISGGFLSIFPVDEKHFAKLNSIAAKILKPGIKATVSTRGYLTTSPGASWFIP